MNGPITKNLDDLVHEVVAAFERSVERDFKQAYLISPLHVRHDDEQSVVQIELDVFPGCRLLFVTMT
jgi:hypothetical protein